MLGFISYTPHQKKKEKNASALGDKIFSSVQLNITFYSFPVFTLTYSAFVTQRHSIYMLTYVMFLEV